VGAIALSFAAFHVWWWGRYRAGLPMFIDEAGYLDFAVDHARAFEAGSATRLRESLDLKSPAAPLVSLGTAVGVLATDRPVGSAVATMAIGAAALIAATWFLARWLLPPRWAVAAAGIVGALPAVLRLSGSYYFATAAAACFTTALACLLRSRWGARLGWAAAAGAAFALAALSRTMLVGFLPAVLVVAVVAATRSDGPATTSRRLAGLAVGAAVAAALAAPWYVPNLDVILDHLDGQEVGRATRGPSTGTGGGAARVTGVPDLRLLVADLLVPMAVALTAATLAAAAWRLAGRATGVERDAAARPGAGAVLAIVGLSGAALVASDQAIGQWLPLLPATIVLALVAVHRWLPARPAGIVLATLAGLSVLHVIEASRLVDPLDGVRMVRAGPLGRLPVLDNRTLLEAQLVRELDGPHLDSSYEQVPASLDDMVTEVATRADVAGEPGVLLVAGGHQALVNLNSLQLADDLAHGSGRLVIGALPLDRERSLDEWEGVLGDPAGGQPNAVLTLESITPDGSPDVPAASLRDALPALGFEVAITADEPDGQRVVLWWRSRAELRAAATP
jgi:hypothetical protein